LTGSSTVTALKIDHNSEDDYGSRFFIKANPFEKEMVVLRYIFQNPGCSQNSIVAAVEGVMRRPSLLKHLKRLVERGIVSEKKEPNGLAFHYSVHSSNPFVVMAMELPRFEDSFIKLLKASVSEIDKRVASQPPPQQHLATAYSPDTSFAADIVRGIFEIFRAFVNTYMFRATVIWHNQVSSDKTRHELSAWLVATIARIQHGIVYELSNSKKLPPATIAWQLLELWGQNPSLSTTVDEKQRYPEILKMFNGKHLDGQVPDILAALPVQEFIPSGDQSKMPEFKMPAYPSGGKSLLKQRRLRQHRPRKPRQPLHKDASSTKIQPGDKDGSSRDKSEKEGVQFEDRSS
jgi:hypothetical protein